MKEEQSQMIPPSVFLGFCAKEYWYIPEQDKWAGIAREICSVSDCISARPPGWVERWDFNRASCWNTEAAAWACVPAAESHKYRLYVYKAIPLVFDTSAEPRELEPNELFDTSMPPLPSEPDLRGFERLGYDVVEYAGFVNYGCSPLSCNGMAQEFPVNEYYLLDSLDESYRAAKVFGIQEPEPGPYIIFEVLRKNRPHGRAGTAHDR